MTRGRSSVSSCAGGGASGACGSVITVWSTRWMMKKRWWILLRCDIEETRIDKRAASACGSPVVSRPRIRRPPQEHRLRQAAEISVFDPAASVPLRGKDRNADLLAPKQKPPHPSPLEWVPSVLRPGPVTAAPFHVAPPLSGVIRPASQPGAAGPPPATAGWAFSFGCFGYQGYHGHVAEGLDENADAIII